MEPGFDPAEAWDAAVTIRHYDATWLLELPQERLKPELRWEVEAPSRSPAPRSTRPSGPGPRVAAALRALLREHDALALPSAQVFPFDVETHWPREIAGRPMPTYHRWMEVMISPASPASAPRAAGVPAGFGPAGLPMGMQLIGRPRGDARCSSSEAYDRATGVRAAVGRRPLGSRPMPEIVLHALPPSHPCMTAEAALKLKGSLTSGSTSPPASTPRRWPRSTARATRPCPAC